MSWLHRFLERDIRVSPDQFAEVFVGKAVNLAFEGEDSPYALVRQFIPDVVYDYRSQLEMGMFALFVLDSVVVMNLQSKSEPVREALRNRFVGVARGIAQQVGGDAPGHAEFDACIQQRFVEYAECVRDLMSAGASDRHAAMSEFGGRALTNITGREGGELQAKMTLLALWSSATKELGKELQRYTIVAE